MDMRIDDGKFDHAFPSGSWVDPCHAIARQQRAYRLDFAQALAHARRQRRFGAPDAVQRLGDAPRLRAGNDHDAVAVADHDVAGGDRAPAADDRQADGSRPWLRGELGVTPIAKIGRPTASRSARSRTSPSVTKPTTPRFLAMPMTNRRRSPRPGSRRWPRRTRRRAGCAQPPPCSARCPRARSRRSARRRTANS